MSSKVYDISTDTSPDKIPDKTPNTSIDELKNLLFKPEIKQIQKIQSRLDDPMLRAKEVSRLLPEAISLSLLNNNKISRIMQPLVDETIKASVKNNPKIMADAIFPALGPGIRKAITSTIMGMIQSLNQVLNHSFSIQGLKWRFEAFRTGKDFGEVVLLHTLLYKVEQIFLIHAETGIVLNHVVAGDTIIQDPDLVSGMLTAIQDFVNDSFHGTSDDDIETLRIGSDRSVWIEKSKYAIIAAVIRGTPPMSLRTQYRELLEEINIKSGASLENFDGDPFPFSIFREQLNDGLRYQKKIEKKRTSPLIWCILFVLLASAGLWGFDCYQNQKAWQNYLTRLNSQKGMIVLSTHKKNGTHNISGLLDPLEKDPLSLIPHQDKNRIHVKGFWKPFHSLDPEFVLQRASQVLEPPPSITLKLLKTTIIAEGKASHQWLDFFKKTAPAIPGVDAVNYRRVQNTDKQKLEAVLNRLDEFKIYFKSNSDQLLEGQDKTLGNLVDTIYSLDQLEEKFKVPFQVVIFGHTDSSGTEKLNLRLSRNRAQKILDFLIIKGINPSFLSISGVGNKIPLREETHLDDRQFNRAVSFKTFHINSTKGH